MRYREVFLLVFILTFFLLSWSSARAVEYKLVVNNSTYENEEEISNVVVKGDDENAQEIGGIWGNATFDYFGNLGTVIAGGEAGDAVNNNVTVDNIIAIYFSENVTQFLNSGLIKAYGSAGNAEGDYLNLSVGSVLAPTTLYGVYFGSYVGSFNNTGTIEVSTSAGNATGTGSSVFSGDAYGVYFDAGVGIFENTGTIKVGAVAGNAIGDSSEIGSGYVYGVFDNGTIDTFINKGNLTVNASIGNIIGNNAEGGVGLIYGAYFKNFNGTFDNEGNIEVSGIIGSATGNNTDGSAESIYGVYFSTFNGTFSNSGAIRVNLTLGNISGYDSSMYVDDVYAIHLNGDVNNFTNSGSILVQATMGDVDLDVSANASGGDAYADAEAYASSIYGLYFSGGVETFKNTGNIGVSVEVGNNVDVSDIKAVYILNGQANIYNIGNITTSVKVRNNSIVSDVAGIWVQNSSNATINNEGLIYLSVDPTLVGSGGSFASVSVNSTAAIYMEDTTATISNPGVIHLYTDIPGANIRTLWLEDSDVTFKDKFSITYGDPGITKRPIYVDDGSSLNLNGAILVARAGVDLQINHPYYNIENDNGTVTGTFSKLEDGTKNPDIKPYWYGPDRGEDSAVIFRYDPKHSASSVSVHASRVFTRNVMNVVISHMVYDKMKWLITEDEKRVKLADSGQVVTDAGNITPYSEAYRNGAFFLPYYFDVEAEDLGYDARGFGFAMGLERRITNEVSAGIFGGISKLDVDFTDMDYGGKDDEQDVYSLGIYANYVGEPWYVGLIAMGYAVQHDYEGLTGPDYDIHEKADYWSHGFEGELVAGYMFGGEDWVVMPEIGVGYSYWRVSDFTTDADYSNWDKKYESESDGYVRLLAGVTGLKRWKFMDTKFDVFASLRLEEAVGDNDIAITQSIPGIGSGKEKVEEDIGDTSFVGRVGFSITLKDRLKLNFTFRSEFNEDYTVYSGRASLGISF